MPTLYIETTIPSYLVSKPNRDIIILAHQQLNKEWGYETPIICTPEELIDYPKED